MDDFQSIDYESHHRVVWYIDARVPLPSCTEYRGNAEESRLPGSGYKLQS